MKRLLFLMALLVSVTGCAQLPKIQPDSDLHPVPAKYDCQGAFPHGRWQLFHIIEATVPGGQKRSLTGVSVVSSRDRSIGWALMTVEGFVLFSGRFDGTLTIDRAIAPFDRPGFAQGLLDDLMLLFFAPQAPHITTGRLENGAYVCRYGSPEETTDLVYGDDGAWSLRQYTSNHRLSRTVVADEMTTVADDAFAGHLVLKMHGVAGYQLELRLVEAIPLK